MQTTYQIGLDRVRLQLFWNSLRIIAQDDAATYVECLECGRIFDTAELDEPPGKPSEFEEDLSDA